MVPKIFGSETILGLKILLEKKLRSEKNVGLNKIFFPKNCFRLKKIFCPKEGFGPKKIWG